MRRYVEAAQSVPAVYSLARAIAARVPGKDHAGEAAAIHAWVRDNVAYRWDPLEHESLQTVQNTLALKTGDCDDMAILIAALAESLGLRSRFVVGGWNRAQYVHVWPEVQVWGRWVALDATENHGPGWRPPLRYLMTAEKR